MLKVRVYATTRFEGFHRWPDAPDEVAFLRNRHRHVFHVRAEKAVSHDDRDVEFILLKRAVEAEIKTVSLEEETETWSCERWASELLQRLQLDKVDVSEDGENGAVVER
jgi:predicted glycosyltransferase involved in capsule biosynthesis